VLLVWHVLVLTTSGWNFSVRGKWLCKAASVQLSGRAAALVRTTGGYDELHISASTGRRGSAPGTHPHTLRGTA